MYVVIVITIDVMDVSSENQDNIRDDIYKLPLDANGNNLTERMQKLGEKKSRAGGEERNEKNDWNAQKRPTRAIQTANRVDIFSKIAPENSIHCPLEVNQNKTASSEVVSTTPKCGSCYGARDNLLVCLVVKTKEMFQLL